MIGILCTASCTTTLSLPPGKAKPGMAAVKGGTRMMPAILNAQYTHVLGVDGIVDKRRAGTRQVAPGKRRMLFACSHHAGAISVVEMTLKLEEGKRYLVEAEAFTGPPVYVVDEVPGRKEIARQQAPLFGAGMSQRGNVLDDVIARYGWRRED